MKPQPNQKKGTDLRPEVQQQPGKVLRKPSDLAEQPRTEKTMQIIIYYYRGDVERGTGCGYAWRPGYSENTPDGAITYPWMTVRECQDDARKRGAIAKFATEIHNPEKP